MNKQIRQIGWSGCNASQRSNTNVLVNEGSSQEEQTATATKITPGKRAPVSDLDTTDLAGRFVAGSLKLNVKSNQDHTRDGDDVHSPPGERYAATELTASPSADKTSHRQSLCVLCSRLKKGPTGGSFEIWFLRYGEYTNDEEMMFSGMVGII